MRNLYLLLFLLTVPCLLGSECEARRLENLDNGMMMDDELTLHPMIIPWDVVADEFEQPRAVDEAMEIVNDAFFPTQVLVGGIDAVRFEEVSGGVPIEWIGTILLSEGFVGTPTWDGELGFEDAGGIADMRWNDDGEIFYVEIIINSDVAYHRESVRRYLVHEFGHAMGLAHDEDSLDLGSCMSSPAPYGFELLESDVQRVLEQME